MTLSPNGANGKGKPDYGTPGNIIAGVRVLLGGVDLDPATTAKRNAQTVQATHVICPPNDGKAWQWAGRVFLNPPGGVGVNGTKAWWNKLCQEYAAGRVTSAVFLAFSLDALQWSQGCEISMLDFPVWILAKRTVFLDHETGEPAKIYNAKLGKWTVSPPKPNALVWLYPQIARGEKDALRKALEEAFGARAPGKAIVP